MGKYRAIVVNVCWSMYDVCQTQYSSQLSAYPGETFRVDIKAFDELERPTAAVLRLSERDVSGDKYVHVYILEIGIHCMYCKLSGCS